MPTEGDFLIGAGFLALMALIIILNMLIQRLTRKEFVKDSEFILAELRFALEDASHACKVLEISKDPAVHFGKAQVFGTGPGSYYRVVRFEIFNHMVSPLPVPPLAISRSGFLKWRCSRDAAAAGFAHFDRDYDKEQERLFLVFRSKEGFFDVTYSKASDFMRIGGGIMKASFNGKRLGIVNFSAEGTITDKANKKIGSAKRNLTSMVVTLHGKEYRLKGPVFIENSFRLAEPDADFAALSEGERMLLVCLSVFNQAFWRSRRVPSAQ